MSKPRLLILIGLAWLLALNVPLDMALAARPCKLNFVSFFQQAASSAQQNRSAVTIIGRYTLTTTGLGATQKVAMSNWQGNDRGLNLGGLFSGLYHAQNDPENIFYAIADRGPNSQIKVEKECRRTFPVPEYNPVIYKLALAEDQIQIVGETPIHTLNNQPVTGLPNTERDEAAYSYDGQTRLQLNPNGIDPEGLTRATDGTFWIAEEYSPSVSQVAPDGTLVHRLIPPGMTLAADTDLRPVLPAIYVHRRPNRGFEGLTISQDNSSLFVALQSPLDFPTPNVGRASRMMRLLVVDTHNLKPVAEYVYVAESASSFGTTKQGKMKIGDLAFVNPTTLLVVERTNKRAHIYQVDLSGATNILETHWSELPNTTQALEALSPVQLAANGITPVSKSLLVDLSQIPEMPKKIEGLTIVNPTTLAVGNDNDFGFDGFDATGRAVNNNVPNELVILRLPQVLPLNTASLGS
ncbi:MAG: esterase-like activity of phytase family protein [Chroococcidiopsidaceae cyanobacterium CP_BM_ER_R8_30]|nr:esterase-like activity of phytase family protein [Chroococcidiopsidaceae cyanobacterium CP_BM_ER_R8_30]